ncbi:trypsin-like peptidase domain-containing protein [Bdellovibrionota bacterium FG-2]
MSISRKKPQKNGRLLALTSAAGGLLLATPLIFFESQPDGQTTPTSAKFIDIFRPRYGSFTQTAQRILPAVVGISTLRVFASEGGLGAAKEAGKDKNELDPLGIFSNPLAPSGQAEHPPLSFGSGVFIREDGLILTNFHVVEKASKITVIIDEKQRWPARLLAYDSRTDLALVQIEKRPSSPVSVLQFGNSDEMNVGDPVFAVGSPFGLIRSLSAGIISAKGRGRVGILEIEDFLQTDAAINPGSSGGPLLNFKGEIIGLNTAILSAPMPGNPHVPGGGFMGIGFSIPSKIAQDVVGQLLSQGYVKRGWVGVAAQDLTPELADFFGTSNERGAILTQIVPGSPAANAKLQPGDVVVRFSGAPTIDAMDMRNRVNKSVQGSKTEIEVIRSKEHIRAVLEIGTQPRLKGEQAEQTQQAGQAQPQKKTSQLVSLPRGIETENVPAEIAHYLKLPDAKGALVVSILPGGAAFEAGIMPGDIVLSVNRVPVVDSKSFRRRLQSAAKTETLVLYVQRGEEEKIFVALKA